MEVAVSLEGFGWVNFCAAWAGREGQCLWKESPSESGVSVSGLRTEFSFLFFFFLLCFISVLFLLSLFFLYIFFHFFGVPISLLTHLDFGQKHFTPSQFLNQGNGLAVWVTSEPCCGLLSSSLEAL